MASLSSSSSQQQQQHDDAQLRANRKYQQYFSQTRAKYLTSNTFVYNGISVLFIVTRCGVLVFQPHDLFILFEAVKEEHYNSIADPTQVVRSRKELEMYKPIAQQRFMAYKRHVTRKLNKRLVIYTFASTPLTYVYKSTPFINATQLRIITPFYLSARDNAIIRDIYQKVLVWIKDSPLRSFVQRQHAPVPFSPPAPPPPRRRPIVIHRRGGLSSRLTPPPSSPPPRCRSSHNNYESIEIDDSDDNEQEKEESSSAEEEETREFQPPSPRSHANEDTSVNFNVDEEEMLEEKAKAIVDEMPSADETKRLVNKAMLGQAVLDVLQQIASYLSHLKETTFVLNIEVDAAARGVWEGNTRKVERMMNHLLQEKKYGVSFINNSAYQIELHADE